MHVEEQTCCSHCPHCCPPPQPLSPYSSSMLIVNAGLTMAKTTRPSKPSSKHKTATASPEQDTDTPWVHWPMHDESELIASLELHWVEAGNGMSVKGKFGLLLPSSWSSTTNGADKTSLACKKKWQRWVSFDFCFSTCQPHLSAFFLAQRSIPYCWLTEGTV